MKQESQEIVIRDYGIDLRIVLGIPLVVIAAFALYLRTLTVYA